MNRIDEFTVFKALQRQDIKRIVKLQAKRVEERLHAKKMKMQLKESAIDFLAVCCRPAYATVSAPSQERSSGLPCMLCWSC